MESELQHRRPSDDVDPDETESVLEQGLQARILEATRPHRLEYIMKAHDLPPDAVTGAMSTRFDMSDIRSPSRASVAEDFVSPTNSFNVRGPAPPAAADLPGAAGATPAAQAKLAESESFLDQVRALASGKREPLTPAATLGLDAGEELVVSTPDAESSGAVVQNLADRLDAEQDEGKRAAPPPGGASARPLGPIEDRRPRDTSGMLDLALKDVVEGYFESTASPVATSIPPPAQEAARSPSFGPLPPTTGPVVPPAPAQAQSQAQAPAAPASAPPARSSSGDGGSYSSRLLERARSNSVSPGPTPRATSPNAAPYAAKRPGFNTAPARPSPARPNSVPSPAPAPTPSTCAQCKAAAAKVEELQTKVRVLSTEVTVARRSLKDAQTQAANASKARQGGNDRSKSWLDASGTSPKSLHKAQAQLAESETAVKVLQEQLARAIEENDALRTSAESLSAQLEIVPHTFMPNKTVEETLKAVGMRLAELERAKLELEGRVAEAQAQAEGLRAVETDRDMVKAQAVRLAGENAALRLEAQALARGTALEHYRTRIDELDAALAAAQARIDSDAGEAKLRAELEEARAQVALLESRLETALEGAAEEERKLNAREAAARADMERAKADAAAALRHVEALEGTVATGDAEVRTLSERLQMERALHRTELEAKGLELLALEEEVEEFRAKLRNLIEKMAASEQAHAEAELAYRSENEAQQAAVRLREDEAAALREALAAAQAETAAAREQLRALREEVAQAGARAGEQEKISSGLTAELASLRVERLTLADKVAALSAQLADANDRLELQGRLWDGAAAAAEAVAAAASTSSEPEVAVLRAELRSLRGALTDTSDRLVARERALHEAEGQRLSLLAELHRIRGAGAAAAGASPSRFPTPRDEGDRLSVSSDSRAPSPGPGSRVAPPLKLDFINNSPTPGRSAAEDDRRPVDEEYLWSVLGKSLVLISVGVGPFVLRQQGFWDLLGLIYSVSSRRLGSDPLFGSSVAMGAAIQATAAVMQGSTPSLARALTVAALLSGGLIFLSEMGGWGIRASSTLALVYPIVASILAVVGNQKQQRIERQRSFERGAASMFSPPATERSASMGFGTTPRSDHRGTPRSIQGVGMERPVPVQGNPASRTASLRSGGR